MTDQNIQQENNQEQSQTQTSALGGGQEPIAQEGGDQGQDGQEQQQPSVVPESIDDYKVEVDGFDYDEFKAIPENQEFLERARAAGFDSEKLNFLLGEYNQLLPKIMEQNAALDAEGCVQAMKEIWQGDTDKNFGFAHAAAQNAIQNGILTLEEVNSPEFGNNPLVLKMAAYFGQQLQEDTPPSNTQQSGGENIQSLMRSEAYLDEKHPDHARVYAEVQKWHEKQYK
ncbi:hypothetical protein [Acinetobacter baumannii]|uniref:hypothetical protein n=1 Tax=Acinetobacter baumannii TaxID=470 RepID=UPI001F2063BD|nr:hypothetical protein [Acinetobacter baumannii]MDO7394657.1 hypothetical protein [Acinetobacter baumannii]UJX48825.1 hypothetical protein HUF98_03635 [Acinetobacter baumannii]